MPKKIDIYLNSAQKIGGNNNDAIYYIDWSSMLPTGRYKCTFCFTQYGNSNTSHASTYSNVIGMLFWYSTGTIATGKGFLYIENNTNYSFVFNNKILYNYMNIKITLCDSTTLWTDTAAAQITSYILCFSFELIE